MSKEVEVDESTLKGEDGWFVVDDSVPPPPCRAYDAGLALTPPKAGDFTLSAVRAESYMAWAARIWGESTVGKHHFGFPTLAMSSADVDRWAAIRKNGSTRVKNLEEACHLANRRIVELEDRLRRAEESERQVRAHADEDREYLNETVASLGASNDENAMLKAGIDALKAENERLRSQLGEGAAVRRVHASSFWR